MNKEQLLALPMLTCVGCGWEIGRSSIMWHSPLCDDCSMNEDIKQQLERESE